MPTSAGEAIVTVGEDYLSSLVGPNDADSQMSFALFKMMDSGRPFYSWDVLHNYFVNTYGPQGIGMIPWTVVRGFSVDGAREEGRQAGIYSTAVQGCALVDLEDDKEHYWQGIEAAVDAWIEAFVEGGGREVMLWPDTRKGHLAGENFWRWWSHDVVTRVWSQVYFAMFYRASVRNRARRGIEDSLRPLLDGGIPSSALTPTLMTSDAAGNPIPWSELEEAIHICHDDYKTNGFALWRRQYLSIEQRDGLRALVDPWAAAPVPQPVPTPLPPVSELAQAIARMKANAIEQTHLADEIIRLAGVGA